MALFHSQSNSRIVDELSKIGVEKQKSVRGVSEIDVVNESGKDNDKHEVAASIS